MKEYRIVMILSFVITVLLSQCDKTNSEDFIDVPDQAFLEALIEEGVDINKDGLISSAETEAITILIVTYMNISNMKGIEAFTNLKTLDCSGNKLKNLDISDCRALEELIVDLNQLTTLDISNNTALKILSCSENQITNLDISNCKDLSILVTFNNSLSSLDISTNTAIESILCQFNQLTHLDVVNNKKLLGLDCDSNQLISLDISNNLLLQSLSCSENQLANLDISNNDQLYYISLINMPTLYQVCVSNSFSVQDIVVQTLGSPNVFFTMDCSN